MNRPEGLRICIYCHQFRPFQGGVQTSTQHLAHHLTNRGHEVIVVTATPKNPGWCPPFNLIHGPSKKQLARIFASSDLVHCQGFALLPIILAILSSRPVVWSHHDYDLLCPKGIAWYDGPCSFGLAKCVGNLRRDHPWYLVVGLIATYSIRLLLQRHPRIKHLSDSEFVRDHNGPRFSAVLHYGILPLSADWNHASFQAIKPDRPPSFVFVGRLIPEKGCHVLLEALNSPQLRELGAEAIIIGDGPMRETLRELAEKYQLADRVRFLGHLEGSEMWNEIVASTAVVIPSIWDEPFGMVAIEAMELGVPVVASRVGGLSESVGLGGLLFERNDASGLAETLARLALDSSLRKELVRTGREVASQHHWTRLSESYEKFYRTVVEGRI